MTAPVGDQRRALLELYDTAMPEVYGYLASRCGSAAIAEDITSDTFLADPVDDDWDVQIDVLRAQETLAMLGDHHRSALVLRYLDGLPVAQVAEHLDRTLHATEALLVRARRAFRDHYGQEER